MTNLMNHFSDDGKRALAAEIKCLFSKSFFEQTCAQKQKRGKILSRAGGDQVFDARCETAQATWCLFRKIQKIILTGLRHNNPLIIK